jgi:hypothetical protein
MRQSVATYLRGGLLDWRPPEFHRTRVVLSSDGSRGRLLSRRLNHAAALQVFEADPHALQRRPVFAILFD